MKICLGEGFMFSKYPFEKAMKEVSEIGYEYVELLVGPRLQRS